MGNILHALESACDMTRAAGGHHGKEVVEARDGAGGGRELLAEGVAQVVRWVGGNDEHISSGCRQLHRQAAGSMQAHNTLCSGCASKPSLSRSLQVLRLSPPVQPGAS